MLHVLKCKDCLWGKKLSWLECIWQHPNHTVLLTTWNLCAVYHYEKQSLNVRYRIFTLQNTPIKATQSKLPARSKMQDRLNENRDTNRLLKQKETPHGLWNYYHKFSKEENHFSHHISLLNYTQFNIVF